eukprot:11619932-Prorocentrum_lima.AAC.1
MGAAAIIWNSREHFHRVAHATLSPPGTGTAQQAEAHGLAMGVALAIEHGSPGQTVSFQGDCMPLLRFCMGHGRIRDPICHQTLVGPLRALASSGLHCQWRVIPRTDNAEADSLARAASRAPTPS